MLVFDMIYVDWIIKKEISIGTWDFFLMLWTLWGLGRDRSSLLFDLGPITQLNKEIARDWTIKAVFKKVNRFQWIQPLMKGIEQLL